MIPKYSIPQHQDVCLLKFRALAREAGTEGWPRLHRAGYSKKGNAFYRDFFHPPDNKSKETCLPNRGSEPTETQCSGLHKDRWFQ